MLRVSALLQSLGVVLCTCSLYAQHISVIVMGVVCGHATGLRSCKSTPCVQEVPSWPLPELGCLPRAGFSSELRSAGTMINPGSCNCASASVGAILQTLTRFVLCRRIQVRPFPRPLGNDGALPLMSSTADIFHIVNPHGATFIRDNFFVNSGAALSL